MQITNKFNLPQPLMAAIENDEYSRGSADISATSLWKAPRIVALEEANADKIVIDANDTGLSFFGRAMHEYLAKRTVDATVENRLYMKREGWVVSGAIDRATLMLGGIEDWKTTTAYVVQNITRKDDWEQQLNTYAHLARENGFDPKYLRIHAIVRDWSQMEALRNPNYPRSWYASFDVALWTPEEAELKICARIREHQAARHELPECSPEDRWLRPGKTAVMKQGRKTAVKLFDTPAEASAFISDQSDSGRLYLESRPSIAMRCQHYCAVGSSGLCSQWNNDPSNSSRSDA